MVLLIVLADGHAVTKTQNEPAPTAPPSTASDQCDLTIEHSQGPAGILYDAPDLLYAKEGRIWINDIRTKIMVDKTKIRSDRIQFGYKTSSVTSVNILGCNLTEDIFDEDVDIAVLIFKFRTHAGL